MAGDDSVVMVLFAEEEDDDARRGVFAGVVEVLRFIGFMLRFGSGLRFGVGASKMAVDVTVDVTVAVVVVIAAAVWDMMIVMKPVAVCIGLLFVLIMLALVSVGV